jgi:tRNA threonylcarbamoyladenosine biosynthesis protein TsaB
MITLAVDTCDAKGSVGVRVDGRLLGVCLHAEGDYSNWLLPAVESALNEAGMRFADLELIAAATGPGSFTGVRVGLCAVKAWAEVYGKRVVGVSRLEAMAASVPGDGWVAAYYDAHRSQIFGGIYRRRSGQLERMDEEMVIGPEAFVEKVQEMTRGEAVRLISLEPELIGGIEAWKEMERQGSKLMNWESGVASAIGELAEAKAVRGEFTDVLELDANYVRRSDAEIYWKGPAYRG